MTGILGNRTVSAACVLVQSSDSIVAGEARGFGGTRGRRIRSGRLKESIGAPARGSRAVGPSADADG